VTDSPPQRRPGRRLTEEADEEHDDAGGLDGQREGGDLPDQAFDFVGRISFPSIASDMGKFVFRSKSDPNFYLAEWGDNFGLKAINTTHHFRAGDQVQWDQYATFQFEYKYYTAQVGNWTAKFPDFENLDYVWRIVASGNVTLDGKELPAGGAKVKLLINNVDGPELSHVAADDQGKFGFDKAGVDASPWVNADKINTITYYYYYSYLGKNYEAHVDTKFPDDYRTSGSDPRAKVLNLDKARTVDFTEANVVDKFHRPDGAEQSQAVEKDGTDSCGCGMVTGSAIFRAIKQAICGLMCWLYDIGVSINQGGAKYFSDNIGVITKK
jgi:hypothetical protein